MESKGQLPPPHLRRPIPGPGLLRPDPFGPGMRWPPGPFPPVDMLPPPEVMEQKIAAQHVEMQRLATENQRLASTHGTLRQELAAAQHELQMLHAQIGAVKSERENQMRNLFEKIAKMGAELQSADHVKLELKQAREEAQKLVGPRITYDYEKKLYDDHLQQLQVMEKNSMAMTKEVEKLRAELGNSASADGRAGPHGAASGNGGGEASAHATPQNACGDNYGVPQVCGPIPPPAAASASGAANAPAGAPSYGGPGAQMGPAPPRPSYDIDRVPGYDPYRAGQGYPQAGYDNQRVAGHDMQRGNYDAYRGAAYPAHNMPAYDLSRGQMYDPQSQVTPGQLRQIPPANNQGYSNAAQPPRAAGAGGGGGGGGGGGNPARK